jgi:ammonium transporter Rh
MEFILFKGIPSVVGGEVTDPGGGIIVHLFAAYWGLGVAMGVREKRAFDEPMFTSKHSVSFAWLAAMLLFILWPSFVTALTTLEQTTPVMANCYMSGFGSMIAAFITCRLCTKKINPLVYMYAMLAGPVGSSSSLLLAGPWQSLLIGIIAGCLSALGFIYFHPWLCKKIGAVDVMGVHELHGVGGWVSLIGGAIFAASIVNLVAGVATLVWGIIGGFITGLIIKVMRGRMEVIFSDDAEFGGHNPDPNPEPVYETKI